jgi:hypothetical protein
MEGSKGSKERKKKRKKCQRSQENCRDLFLSRKGKGNLQS